MYTVEDVLQAVDLLKQNNIGQLPSEACTGWLGDIPTHFAMADGDCPTSLFADGTICWVQTFCLVAKSKDLDPLYCLGVFLFFDNDPKNSEQGRKIIDNFKVDRAIDMLELLYEWEKREDSGISNKIVATTLYLCFPSQPISPYTKIRN